MKITFEDIRVKPTAFDFSQTKFAANSLKLLESKPVEVMGDKLSISLITSLSGKSIFQFVIDKEENTPYAAIIKNLPGFRPSDVLTFKYIAMLSDGNQSWQLQPVNALLHDIMPFKTLGISTMGVTNISFGVTGRLMTGYPKVPSIQTNLSFEKSGEGLEFFLSETFPIAFKENKLQTFLNEISIGPKKFIAEGTVEEIGVFPATKVRLTHVPEKVQIDIKENEKINISASNYFSDVVGEMHPVSKENWSIFWFEGEPKGLAGITRKNNSEPPQRMKFTVNGAVEANDQELSVDRVQSPFGQMKFTYLLPQNRLIGSCNFNKEFIGGLMAHATIESVVDGMGWYFQAGGEITIPGLGSANLYALFGDYSAVSSTIKKGFGSYNCLPVGFKSAINGFLISGSIKKQIFPAISIGLDPLASVDFNADLTLSSRFYTTFADVGNEYALNIKLEGDASASASFAVFRGKGGIHAALGVDAIYNTSTKYFSANGCAGVGMSIGVETFTGVPPVWVSWGTLNADLSAKISCSSGGKFDGSLSFDNCSECN